MGWRDQAIPVNQQSDWRSKAIPVNQQPGAAATGVANGPTPAAEEKDWTDAEIPGIGVSARSAGQATANALPTAGAVIGGTGAGLLATPESLGTATIPASLAGAAAGGAGGQNLKRLLENYFNKKNPYGYKAPISKQLASLNPFNFSAEENIRAIDQGMRDTQEGAKTGLEAETGGAVFNKFAPTVLPYAASQLTGIPQEAISTYAKQAPRVLAEIAASKLPGEALPNLGRMANRIRESIGEKVKTFRGEQRDIINKTLQEAADQGASHEIGPSITALENNGINQRSYPEDVRFADDAASRLRGLTPGPRQPTLQEQKSVSEYLGNYRKYLQQKAAYKAALGRAGTDLNQPAIPGLVDDLQRVQMNPWSVELNGKPPANMTPVDAQPSQQMFLPDLPTGNSEVGRIFTRPGEADFGDLGGNAVERLGSKTANTLEGPAQLDFLNQNTKEKISLFGKQGEIGGTELTPRTYAEVESPGMTSVQGQGDLLIPPVRPNRPPTPWTVPVTRVSPPKLYESKKLLQDLAEGSYAPEGAIFNQTGPGAKAVQKEASKLRTELHQNYPAVAEADKKLSQLHQLDEQMQASLHTPGDPIGPLNASGAGTNVMGRNQLEDLGALTGNAYYEPGTIGADGKGVLVSTPLEDAKRLAAAHYFGKPQLFPVDPTGKAAVRAASLASMGYGFGSYPGMAIGMALTSPRTLKLAIDSGMFTNPIYARSLTPSLVNGATNFGSRLISPWTREK